jgi:hypothetical protein
MCSLALLILVPLGRVQKGRKIRHSAKFRYLLVIYTNKQSETIKISTHDQLSPKYE